MRTFEHFNTTGKPCPICGTHEDKPPVLIALHGTERGNISEAIQVHLDCLEMRAYHEKDELIIAMVTDWKD